MGWAREGPEKRELEWELGQVQGPGEEVRGQGELRELRKLALGQGQLAEAPPLARWQMVKLAENGQREQGQLVDDAQLGPEQAGEQLEQEQLEERLEQGELEEREQQEPAEQGQVPGVGPERKERLDLRT